MWLRDWLRAARLRRDARPQHHRRQRQDLRRRARRERRARARATPWYLEDTADFGLGMPDELPLATDRSREIVRFIEELVDARPRLRGGGRRLLPGRELSRATAASPASGPIRSRSRSRARSRRICATSRSGRRPSRRGHGWDSPWGRGRPGWHIECSAMAEETFGPGVRDPRRRARPRLPTPRERARAVARARPRVRAHLDAQRDARSFGGEKMSKSLGNDVTLRNVLDTWGREVAAVFFLGAHWRKPIDFGDEVLVQARRRSILPRRLLGAARGRGRGDDPRRGARRRARRRLQHSGGARSLSRVARSRGVGVVALGARSVRPRVDRPGRGGAGGARGARGAAARGARREGLRGADRLRDEIAAAGWEVRDVAEPPGYRLVRHS